ncbi:hypothetical protein PYCCODRAFT_1434045 [Trametes coccinea BRFM310]|uniref:Uncharacterized protein n=1 Tax=Trametes coccinea (strain BRFM310) TaxID=1353009 RepID=A0A1Y2IRE2_TRAC3|nr:hypothetical protein PYCCODRAFT_1434045 [Trametes coccinea BRFM310]
MPAHKTEQSLGSDDVGIMAAVAAQMQSSWEKKRKEKEAKFLQMAKADLDKCVTARLDEFNVAVAQLNGAYDKFVMEYAKADDKIRKLWLQLQHEQEKLLMFSEKKHKAMSDNDRERERGQVKGMAVTKKAVEDFGKLITSLEEL